MHGVYDALRIYRNTQYAKLFYVRVVASRVVAIGKHQVFKHLLRTDYKQLVHTSPVVRGVPGMHSICMFNASSTSGVSRP